MTTPSFARTILFFTVLFSSVLIVKAQNQPAKDDQPAPPINVDIVYTGRLFGYFRLPSLQNIKARHGCHEDGSLSQAAEQFLKKQSANFTKDTVLVGTGDNFAPQLEAREFAGVAPDSGIYTPANKELYVGNNGEWLLYTKLQLDEHEKLRDRIEGGLGTIPTDNVACFLRRAGYSAVVPGKHDFYFGPERLRQLARFLARPSENGDFEPVQMLGANLVMKTEPIESTTVSNRVKANRTFKEWPTAYLVMNLNDGGSVYPWFSVVKIQLAEIPSESKIMEAAKHQIASADVAKVDSGLRNFIESKASASELDEPDQKRFANLQNNFERLKDLKSIRICASDGHPNQLPESLSGCAEMVENQLRIEGTKIVLYAYLQDKIRGKGGHFSTLSYAKNFGLCTKNEKDENACIRFSTHTPFFYFPHEVAQDGDGYTDPEPYTIKNNVAVFGVVDQTLGEQVGALNFGWRHASDAKFTTQLSAEDPVDALQQQLDYFERRHPKFNGLKVLLAQMTPQRARELAANFPQFQVVVSAADHEQATSNITMSTNWRPLRQSPGQFLAVPAPYFNSATRTEAVHFGMIDATPLEPKMMQESPWALIAKADAGDTIKSGTDPSLDFWKKVRDLDGCTRSDFPRNRSEENFDNITYLKWLVLCTMQQHLGADVALIQTQDLFDKIPLLDVTTYLSRASGSKSEAETRDNVQQTLDRLIWKGDFITLLHVPGAALKSALAKSEEFENAENAKLALSVDKGRKLEPLGIRKEKDEYFINELPIEDDRIYTVATTDYIGAGDTGYPDLAKAARNPRRYPAAFPAKLIAISSLVCRKFFSEEAQMNLHCFGPIESNSYLDTTTLRQIEPYPPEGRLRKILASSSLSWPNGREGSTSIADGLEHRVQRRSFRAFSLRNFSIGFKDLDNNRTDENLDEKFAGVSTSGVSSKENRNITVSLDARFSYFADKREFFIGTGIDYDREATGDPTKATGISLNTNRLFGDMGVVWWRQPGREFPNIGIVSSVRGETQLERPFSAFNLSTEAENQIRITQRRGLLLLGRLGVRWQNRSNSLEIGAQGGREMRALRGYRFENPGGTSFECLVNSAQTLGECITENSKPPDGLITASSIPSALLQARPRAGIYWNQRFSFPILSNLKWEFTQDADFFFVNFARDTSIDTRFRFNSKNRLSFMIWKNFSIGPVLDLFMYQNKVNRNFLFQRSIGIETNISFDIFNRREKKAQIIDRN